MPPQLVGRFRGEATAVGLEDLRGDVVEEILRQAERPDLVEFRDLLQEAFQVGRAGIGEQPREDGPAGFWWLLRIACFGLLRQQQRFQSLADLRRQALTSGGTETRLEAAEGRSHQAVCSFRRRRFDVQGSETFESLVAEMVGLLVVSQDVFDEPGDNRLAVFQRRLAESEERADLSAVVLDGATVPVVTHPLAGCDVDLASDVLDDDVGHVEPLPWETSLTLKELQQDGKAEARRAGLVDEQMPLAGRQGPVLGQLIGVPVALHAAPPPRGRQPRPFAARQKGGCTKPVASIAFRSMGGRRNVSSHQEALAWSRRWETGMIS